MLRDLLRLCLAFDDFQSLHLVWQTVRPGNFQDVSMAAGRSARASKRVCWVLRYRQGTCWTAMVHMHGPVCLQALHKDTMPMANMYCHFWSLISSQSHVLFLSGDVGA